MMDLNNRKSTIKDNRLRIVHSPVLLKEVLDGLNIEEKDAVFDGTLGGGGHARAICDLLSGDGVFIGLDADSDAVDRARKRLAGTKPKKMLFTGNFMNIHDVLKMARVKKVDKILLDLGWSMYQVEASGRGFSFIRDEPLLMTFKKAPNEETDITARKIINEWSEESIANIIYGYGEEKYAKKIAKSICEARKKKYIGTSKELADIVVKSFPKRAWYGRIHPATKTFQALRIAVNDELSALKKSLKESMNVLESGGRIAVIAFHSIEDRIVKDFFATCEKEGGGARITKKPITASREEIKVNKKARSAKLRIFEKNKL